MNGAAKKLSILFLAGGLIAGGCGSAKKDTGHLLIRDKTGKDAASAAKDRILRLPNDDLLPYSNSGSNRIQIQYRLLHPDPIKAQTRYPLVLVPQFPQRSSNYHLDTGRNVLVSTPDPCLGTVLELIDSLKKTLPVNADRIYVMGFSMGGSGAINSLELRPDLFAAAVSISGIPAMDHLDLLEAIPIWLIHGNADHENPMGGDSLLFREMQTRHALRMKFWEIDQLDHAVFSDLYTTDVVPRWLFRHRKARVF